MTRFRCRSLLIALTVLLLPTAALAGNMAGPGGATSWTIYALANGQVLYNILNSAKMMVSSSEFRTLVEFMVMLGLMGMLMGAAFGVLQPKKIAGIFILTTMFLTLGLGTTTSVVIEDPVTGYTNVVTDAPILVVLPEAIVSTAGREITRMFETFYSTPSSMPSNLTLSGGGSFNLASSLLQASTQVQVTDPELRATMANFMSNCLVPAIVTGRIAPGALLTSTKLWGSGGTIAAINPSPMSVVYTDTDPSGVVLPCGAGGVATGSSVSATNSNPSVSSNNAYDYISDYIQTAAPQWLTTTAGAWNSTAAAGWASSVLASAQSYLFSGKMTQPTGETIQQAAAINMMGPGLNAAAVASGQSQMVTAMAVAQGEQSQVSGWATAVSLFRDLSGYIYSVLQAFLIAMTPIIIAVIFMPGIGKTMGKSYLQIVVWLALWEPVLSIINYIVNLYARGELTGALSGSGGYSMESLHITNQLTSHMVLAAGFLATSVPLLTWALVKGSFAFTEFLAGGLGANMANLAGSIAATGNISLGNQSFDNVSMNQRQLMATTIAGTDTPRVNSGDMMTQTELGLMGGSGGYSATGKISQAQTLQQSREIARLNSISQSVGKTASTEAKSALSAGFKGLQQLSEGGSHSTDGGTNASVGTNAGIEHAAGKLLKAVEHYKVGNAADAQQLKNLQAGGSVKPGALAAIGREIGALFGAEGSEQFEKSNGLKTSGDHGVSGDRGTGADDKASVAARAQRMATGADIFRSLSDATKTWNHDASQQFSQAASEATRASIDYTTAQQAREAASAVNSQTAAVPFNNPYAVSSLANRAAGSYKPAPTYDDDLKAVIGVNNQVGLRVGAPGSTPTINPGEGASTTSQGEIGAAVGSAQSDAGKPLVQQAQRHFTPGGDFSRRWGDYRSRAKTRHDNAERGANNVTGGAWKLYNLNRGATDTGLTNLSTTYGTLKTAVSKSTASPDGFNIVDPSGGSSIFRTGSSTALKSLGINLMLAGGVATATGVGAPEGIPTAAAGGLIAAYAYGTDYLFPNRPYTSTPGSPSDAALNNLIGLGKGQGK